MLFSFYTEDLIEAGCDEAGRGCLAGPVFAAAVILPKEYKNDLLNDSKKLTDKRRRELRPHIEKDAVAWAIAMLDNVEIDKINILNASIEAMHQAVSKLVLFCALQHPNQNFIFRRRIWLGVGLSNFFFTCFDLGRI